MKKILLVYCNLYMEPLLPLGIASITASLKKSGYEVALFDTTLYPRKYSDTKDREDSNQVKTVDWGSVGITPKTTYMYEDFINKIEEFTPDIVAFSVTENTWDMVELFIAEIYHTIFYYEIEIVIGGIFSTFAHEYIRDYANHFPKEFKITTCIGEGEWFIQNEKKDLICDLKDLPTPDFSLFDDNRIYRPMDGKLYRMLPIEIGRGCPHKCSYCSAPSYAKKFNGWNRTKTPEHVIHDMWNHAINYDVEYFYLVSETFFSVNSAWKEEFAIRYEKSLRIPFWMNTRPEAVNQRDIKRLAEIGCHRISMGLECGNEQYRCKVLKRNYSNERVIEAARIIKDAGIQLSINNMIGFPDETREMIEETIEVNKRIEADSHTVSIFAPFRGTALHKVCVDKGYFPENAICPENFGNSLLTMPQISKEEIREYYLTFNGRIK